MFERTIPNWQPSPARCCIVQQTFIEERSFGVGLISALPPNKIFPLVSSISQLRQANSREEF
jgi:hypothetical protein